MKSTVTFTKTLDSISRTGKLLLRKKSLDTVLTIIEGSGKDKVRILTLPSIYWLFEKQLLKSVVKKYGSDKTVIIHGFEHNWRLFCLSSMKIVKSLCASIKQIMCADLNYQKIKSMYFNHSTVLHHIDVFKYLEHTDKVFDFMWIDLLCPIDHVGNELQYIPDRLCTNGTVIISFLKGRERTKIVDRTQFVKDALSSLEFVEEIVYNDTTTMINLIFTKKSPIDIEELLTHS